MGNENYEVVLAEVFIGVNGFNNIKLLDAEDAFDKLYVSVVDDGYADRVKWIEEVNGYRVSYAIYRRDGEEISEKEATKLRRLYWRFYRN